MSTNPTVFVPPSNKRKHPVDNQSMNSGKKQKLKSSGANIFGQAIALPHDGYIWHSYISNNARPLRFLQGGAVPNSVETALSILQKHKNRSGREYNDSNDDKKENVPSPCNDDYPCPLTWRLFQGLVHPCSSEGNHLTQPQKQLLTLKDQLQALQRYRSQLLNHFKAGNTSPQLATFYCGIYHLLMEWSLSIETPSNLERAIQSCLQTIRDTCIKPVAEYANKIDEINDFTLHTILDETSEAATGHLYWKRPLTTLLNLLTTPTFSIKKLSSPDPILRFVQKTTSSTVEPILDSACSDEGRSHIDDNGNDMDMIHAVETTVQIAAITKVFFTDNLSHLRTKIFGETGSTGKSHGTKTIAWDTKDTETDGISSEMEDYFVKFFWKALCCRGMNSDALAKVSVSYGQVFLVAALKQQQKQSSNRIRLELQHIQTGVRLQIEKAHRDLPHLHMLSILQGLMATLYDEILFHEDIPCNRECEPSSLSLAEDPMSTLLLRHAETASDRATRLVALRGLQTLVNRYHTYCSNLLSTTSSISKPNETFQSRLIQKTLDLVMSAWENPPGRQVASAIPSLFESLIPLLLSSSSGDESLPGNNQLLERILQQPVHRRGRYIALEMLLPVVGAQALLDATNGTLIQSLVRGICESNQNAGIIADLLGKLLNRLRMQMNEGTDVHRQPRLNQKQRRKLKKQLERKQKTEFDFENVPLAPDWVALWAPHVAKALLLSVIPSHQRRCASFCLPMIITSVGGDTYRLDALKAFSALLDELDSQYQGLAQEKGAFLSESMQSNTETLYDRAVWAKLQIARSASSLKLLGMASASSHFRVCLVRHFSVELIKKSLTHSSERLRLVAFAALEALVPSFYTEKSEALAQELALWRFSLPYVFKSGGKEYISTLLQILASTMDRASLSEAEIVESNGEENMPLLTSFIDFLIKKILVEQIAYPGTVYDKEIFVMPLFRCIVNFLSRDSAGLLKKAGAHPKSNARRLRQAEQKMRVESLQSLVSHDGVFRAFLCMLLSMWDNSRSNAYQCLLILAGLAHSCNLDFPSFLVDKDYRSGTEARAFHLCSSPRQREADSGARLLAILFVTLGTEDDRFRYLQTITNALWKRVGLMKTKLEGLLSTPAPTTATDGTSIDDRIGEALSLPLAHGILQALRFLVENLNYVGISTSVTEALNDIVSSCCDSIEISLSIVADLKEDSDVNLTEQLDDGEGFDTMALSVNTGAIGANATFSSVTSSDDKEAARRFATQRVVIGSWLLVREACATLATTVTTDACEHKAEMFERAGRILITTMISLKHQGAAYASSKAFQQIATFCCQPTTRQNLRQFPKIWIQRLLSEISSAERVRDSTLRRSTGYGLGFLSMMRSELPSTITPKSLCPFVLAQLVALSLPPRRQFEEKLVSIGVSQSPTSILSQEFKRWRQLDSAKDLLIDDREYEPRCRIHALNILRLIILDAPLASDVRPFVADSLIAALLGYTDTSWGVRNSATMVYSATMLRVVDSDKNAKNKAETGGNAITAVELFRQYPPLPPFLHAMARADNNDKFHGSISPPIYLILLVFSRIQPIYRSEREGSEITDKFIECILGCLSHPNSKIRSIAADALSNLSTTNEPDKPSYFGRLMQQCGELIHTSLSRTGEDWNLVHGALMGLQALQKCHVQLFSNNCFFLDIFNEHVRNICNHAEIMHPTCASVAISIWYEAITTNHRTEPSSLLCFASRCCEIINNAKNLPPSGRAAFAPLGVACSKCGCDILTKLFWSSNTAATTVLLKNLFTSQVFDARVTSIKVFKKSIYGHIDAYLERQSQSSLLLELCDVLVEASLAQASLDSFGLHPPSVRRLTRCLLETMYALMSRASCRSFPDHLSGKLWAICDMITRELKIDSNNLMLGNVAELMSIGISSQSDIDEGSFVHRVEAFIDLIAKLNDPHGPWRVRYSIARAIEVSGFLHTHQLKTKGLIPFLSRVKSNLQTQVFTLLQDNDPDVRFIATRSLSVSAEVTSPLASTHLMAIEQSFQSTLTATDGSLSGKMIQSSLSLVGRLRDQMQGSIEDLKASQDPSSPSHLFNLSTRRKIFEEEDPNPYEEPLIMNELLVSTMLERGETIKELPCGGELVSLANDLLCVIMDRMEKTRRHAIAPDLFHDITWNNSLFPHAYGVLLVTAAAVYLGLEGSSKESLQELAKKTTECIRDCEKHSVHPKIETLIQALASASRGSDETKNTLIRLCCLLPSYNP